jgi:hypothetical protein
MYRAIVVDTQPIQKPKKTRRVDCALSLPRIAHTSIRTTAQVMARLAL